MTLTAEIPVGESDSDRLQAFLNTYPNVGLINVQWVDLCGASRSRLVPVPSFIQLIKRRGHLSGSCIDLTLPLDNEILPQALEMFDYKQDIVPDVTSLKIAAHDTARIGNLAVCHANIEGEKEWDPRVRLGKQLVKAEKELGLKFLVGFELEFSFLEMDKITQPTLKQRGMYNAGLTYRSPYWPILNEITVALTEAGIFVEQVHKEYGVAQFEISLPPLPPVQSADACVFARETVKDIAHKHGLFATVHPDPTIEAPGAKTGQHIHISANPTNDKVDFDSDSFLGGILSHIPALCALGMTNVDSYSRTEAGSMGSGAYVGWGENNRAMPVRRVTKNHWEIRANDATSNPYLILLGIINAGLDKKPLTQKPVQSKSCSPDLPALRF